MSKKKGKELVPVAVRAITALGMKECESELTQLAASTVDIVSITNPDGYKQVRSARLVLKNLRVEIQNAGKAAREDATAFSKAVIAEERRLIALIQPEEARLEALEAAEDQRIEAEKQAEIDRELARQASLQERVAELRGCQMLTPTSGSELLAQHIADLEAIVIDDSFQEYFEQAQATKAAGLSRLRELHAAAIGHETEQRRLAAERAELERLRAEAAQRVREEAERGRQAAAARQAEERRHAEQLRAQVEAAEREQRERQRLIDAENERVRAANEAEQQRLAAERAEIERQQAELRKAQEPAPTAPETSEMLSDAAVESALESAPSIKTLPSREEIVDALCDEFGLTEVETVTALAQFDWRTNLAEAA